MRHHIHPDQTSYYEHDEKEPIMTARGCLTSAFVGIILGLVILALIYFQK